MASAWFGPCPHCNSALSFLVGVSGSRMNPPCPLCRVAITVTRATFIMADNSRRVPYARAARPPASGGAE
jgi:hypothetical protein